MTHARRYVRDATEHTETVWVHITDDGYVKMTAENLHDVLSHIGFVRADTKEPTR